MTGRSPLTLAGSWQTARQHCDRGCFGYHAPWRLFRQAGLKASPRWHAGLYRRILAGREPWRPTRVLVCATSDETMPAVLARLVPGVEFVVADACATPLRLVEAWAARAGTPAVTVRSRAPQLARVEGPFDLVAADGLLSLLPTVGARNLLISRLADLLADDGLLLYTTRIAGAAGVLEYDLAGRLLQSLAAATWPAPARERAQLARDRWQRPSRAAPFTSPQQVATAFRAAFTRVRLFTRTTPPTLALAAHPRFWTGRGSVCVGVAATAPRNRP